VWRNKIGERSCVLLPDFTSEGSRETEEEEEKRRSFVFLDFSFLIKILALLPPTY